MLVITVPDGEMWDEKNQEFLATKGGELRLEHSLIAVSKWEARWHRSFISGGKKSRAELLDYIRCMRLDGKADEDILRNLTNSNINDIVKYIEEPMTATVLRADNGGGQSGDKITSELIYYWMISFGIPFECQYWHLNRLMTLIRLCGAKSRRSGTRKRNDMLRSNAALNAARKAKYGTRG